MMRPKYHVFICHRGPDTKHNIVSVLNGMLMTKGITCFVDYRMKQGDNIDSEITDAIRSSRVHVIILSGQFASSKYCMNEVIQIKEAHDVKNTSHRPCKVIAVFYDVEPIWQAKDDSYGSKGSRTTEKEWGNFTEALKSLSVSDSFEYCKKTTFQWEKVQDIVKKIEEFLTSQNIISVNWKIGTYREWQSGPHDVFICHLGRDTQHNVVSVLRGMLLSKGIRCFIVGYRTQDGGRELKPEIEKIIQNSKVHVIFLSPEFASSEQCLEEVVQIMNKHSSSGTADASCKPKTIPIFCDVDPSVVRHHIEPYDLQKVKGSTQEQRDSWSKALTELCNIKGPLYQTSTTFQWEMLYDVLKRVEGSVTDGIALNHDLISETSYKEKIDQVSRILESREAQDVSLIGVYGRCKSQFADVLVDRFRREFDAICPIYNVMEKASDPRGISKLVEGVYDVLIESSVCEQLNPNPRRQVLESKKYMVVLDDLGNNMKPISKILEEVIKPLRNGSLVVLASEFLQMLQELRVRELRVCDFIDLSKEDNRGIVNICYGEGDNTRNAFLNHLQEVFYMLGLDVHLLDKDVSAVDPQDADVPLCIRFRNLSSIGDSGSTFTNAAITPMTICMSCGSYRMDERISNTMFELEVNFDESELDKWEFKSMVKEVLQTLSDGHEKIMEATDFPVGLAERVKELMLSIPEKIESSGNRSVQCFAIVGMGGVGKTTLAMSAYNRLHSRFEKSFFSLNTRATVAKDSLGVVAVQKSILYNLYKDEQINDEVHGKAILSCRLKGINALVVLDDVDEIQHIHALYDPLRSSLGPNSVVIITSRNKEILKCMGQVKSFNVKLLDEEESRRLFCWHAFLKPKPTADLEEIAGSVIEACKGLPLSLKVMGSHLYHRSDRKYWEESLFRLKRKEDKIFEVLRISYDGLSSDAKEAFLDICCFLIDEDEDYACMVLEACYGIGLSHLRELEGRCLITTSAEDDGKARRVRMHNQIRNMGIDIIWQSIRNRGWDDETANNILQDEKARSLLRGLSIRSHIPSPKGVSDCKQLPELRILLVEEENGKTHQERLCPHKFFENVHCDGLRWLRWRSAPFETLPRGVQSTSIRVLDLSGGSEIRDLPMDSFTNLRRLDVSGCRKLNLDSRIAVPTNLTHLNLSECDGIKFLPQEMTKLTGLEQLILNNCTSLETLFLSRPYQTLEGPLPGLQELTLRGCPKLGSLYLEATSMRRLDLSRCGGLKELNCKGLSSLEKLNLDLCSSLTTLAFLPTTLQTLSLLMDENQRGSLQSVNLDSSLPRLRELAITWCRNLETSPLHATSMQRLLLTGCSGIKKLDCEGLPALEELNLDHCSSLGDFSCPKSVKKFSFVLP